MMIAHYFFFFQTENITSMISWSENLITTSILQLLIQLCSDGKNVDG